MSDLTFNTQLADLEIPENWVPHLQLQTEEKSRLIQSGAIARSGFLDSFLAGGGLTTNVPSFNDLDNDAPNTPTDDTADEFKHLAGAGDPAALTLGGTANGLNTITDARPKATSSIKEVAYRNNRNQVWAASQLANQLVDGDPVSSILSRIANYWSRDMQREFVATVRGVAASDGVNNAGSFAFDAGDFAFSADAVLLSLLTIGDSSEDMSMIMMDSTVMTRAKRNNLITFIPDARGEVMIPTFLGMEVIVDDGMPRGDQVVLADGTAAPAYNPGVNQHHEVWIFGPGVVQMGMGSAEDPAYIEKRQLAGRGGGQTVIGSRVLHSMHPTGFAVQNVTTDGGLSDVELAQSTRWVQAYPERKQIKICRLIVDEAFAPFA